MEFLGYPLKSNFFCLPLGLASFSVSQIKFRFFSKVYLNLEGFRKTPTPGEFFW